MTSCCHTALLIIVQTAQEIALTESDMEVYKGLGGDKASRPSRLLLCFRASSSH